jgi:hypothetical protein
VSHNLISKAVYLSAECTDDHSHRDYTAVPNYIQDDGEDEKENKLMY